MRMLQQVLMTVDQRLLLAFLLLCCISLALLWSVTEPIRGPYEDLDPGVPKAVFFRQVLWFLAGAVALLTAARIPLRQLENAAWPLYLTALLMLILVLVLGPSVSGSRRWLVLGPFRMQPSELAKIATIVLTANFLSRPRAARKLLWPTLLTFLLTTVYFLLVLREPDLGTALVFPAIWVGMIFWFGISGVFLLGIVTTIASGVVSFYSESVLQHAGPWSVYIVLVIGLLYAGRFRVLSSAGILLGNIIAGLGIPYFWERLQDYQQKRVMSFFDPASDAFGSGYQVIQSKVAIGSGGLFGTHYLQGTQKGLAFLPERHTDFIFSVAGEELGFAGAAVILALYLFVILRGLELAQKCRRPFPAYLAIGIVTYFAFHVVVNVAITTGLLPVTGMPLPLMSYGGSNLLVSAFLFGLLINIDARSFDT